jgi:hypothetical protein
MTCKINADTSDGLKIVSDTSGTVDIQNNGTTIAEVSSSGLAVTVAGSGVTDALKLTTTATNSVPGILFSGDISDSQVDLSRIRCQQDNSTVSGLVFETKNSGTIAESLRVSGDGKVFFNGTTSLSTSQTSWRWDIDGVNYGNRASAGTMQSYRVGGTAVGSIYTGASSTTYNTSSDYRLKENVDYTWDATTRLKQLKPARFNFINDDTNTLVDGFIAHEVSSIVPEAITGAKDAVDEDGNPDYQGIDQSKLVPLLVKTIQELEARITALES